MHPAVNGFLAGVIAGVVMAVLSDLAYRCRVFKSSLVIIDGYFLVNTIKAQPSPLLLYSAGIPIHLVTSGIFGAIYAGGTDLLGLPSQSFFLVAIYFLLLWLSMLFIALPTAGQGMLGRKAGRATWLEQLVLHIIFGAAYIQVLSAL